MNRDLFALFTVMAIALICLLVGYVKLSRQGVQANRLKSTLTLSLVLYILFECVQVLRVFVMPRTPLFQEYSHYFSLISFFVNSCLFLAFLVIAKDSANAELHYRASTDQLTGLLNRQSFFITVQKLFLLSRRHERHMSCLYIDIDYFKRINDMYGHGAGDAILKSFSYLLKKTMRESDVVSRLGGEEFAVVMPDTSMEMAMQAAERFRLEVERTCFNAGKQDLYITTSIGVFSEIPSRYTDIDHYLHHADEALLEAKRRGRNQIAQSGIIASTEKIINQTILGNSPVAAN